MEKCFLTLYLSPNSPTYGKKRESAVGAGFSFLRAGRQANRILRARGLADSEATPTAQPQRESLIRVIPKSEAPPSTSWWIGFNPLRSSPAERYAASRNASGQPAPKASRAAASSAKPESASTSAGDEIPKNYVRTANGSLIWREICDPVPSKAPAVSRSTQDLRDAITRSNNATMMSYVQRPARLEDYADVDPGCARWNLAPLRDEPPVSDGRLHFYDEHMGDVTGDVVNDPERQGHSEGEGVTAKFHIPTRRK